jgi:hypothetical protein
MTIEAKKNIKGAKTLKFAGLKTTPSRPTDEQLARINQFTRRPFTADEIYVGQLRLANNAIDRDNERFSEEVLARFAATAIRKTMLFDHSRDSQDSAVGKFFDVTIEKTALQQANADTGEDLTLPANVTEVQFLCPWFYIPVNGVDDQVIVKIDAGIYDFASIGFRCESCVPVLDPKDGKILFWEYRGTGKNTEMTEGSLVYLGAQHGMAVKSTDKTIPGEGKEAGNVPANSHEGGQLMKDLLAKLRALYGKTFSEDGLFEELKAFVDEKLVAAVEAAVAPLKTKIAELEPLTARVAELTPLAADGKAYRDGLVQTFVTLKAKLAECAETTEAQDALKKVVALYPVDFLKAEVGHLQARVDEKFPDGSQLGKKDDPSQRDKSKGAAEAGKKHPLDPNKDK